MKTRIHGIFAVLAVVVLTTALLVTCSGPFDLSGLVGKGSDTKTGSIKISIAEPGARTIMPTEEGNAFTSYMVTIEGVGSTDDPEDYPKTVVFNSSGVATLLDVPEGVYDITVEALIGTKVAATGKEENVPHDDATTSVVIELKVIDDEGTGLFTYNITLPTGADAPDTATIKIGTGTATSILGGANVNATGTSVTSGMHEVVVTLIKANHQTRIVTEVLYIFQGMTSDWSVNIPKNNKNVYTVTFSGNGGSPASVTQTIQHLDTLETPATPTNSGYVFDGWFTAASGGTEWTFPNSTKIYSDFTLYAQWSDAEPEPALGITVTFTMPGDPGTTITPDAEDGYTISQAALLTGATLTFTIDLDELTPSKIEWLYNGLDVGDNDETFVFDDSNNAFSEAGAHIFTIRVTIDGKLYTTEEPILVTVTPSSHTP